MVRHSLSVVLVCVALLAVASSARAQCRACVGPYCRPAPMFAWAPAPAPAHMYYWQPRYQVPVSYMRAR